DLDPAEEEPDPRNHPALQLLDDRRLRLLARLGVPVHGDGTNERRPRREVERRDPVLLAEMEVDGTFVNRRERTFALRCPEDRPGVLVDDDKSLRVAGAEGEPRGRSVPPAPDAPRRP